ncbi:EAL domain-containing protein [Sulfurimonas sp. C5]|uniref:EAL and HDOD domain-containing protein n=1 Tax=Sulfurimonas sp. C5 TaxID=3036947 RepID=UPI002457B285|nr:EAL domain-containing protein [Sulfurimonas sp. C5]MDH4944284.1 EAL domain-containing protein [Sulfurimonas sp. C5]
MEHVYLARQVILRDDASLFAYEVLYRDSKKRSDVTDDRYASSAVISSILNRFGTKEVLKEKRAFIKIDEKFLLSDLIFSIPNEFFIFSLFDDIEMDERILERLHQLHKKGYLLGISDTTLTIHTFEKYHVVMDYISYFKLDFSQELEKEVETMIESLKASNIKVIGSKIDTHEKFDLAKEIGCDYFQGYYFAKPKILESEKLEASRANVLHLYNLLMQETNIDELANEFEKNPEISLQLLQFINSGAFFFMKRISSIHHVITLLGRMKLAEWLMLMIYSKTVSHSNEHSPLMQTIQTRAVMMEKVLKIVKPESGSNMLGEAYFTGILSALDVVLNAPLAELLDSLHISNEVKDAILEHKGLMGDIFQLVQDVEVFNIEGIITFETKYNLEPTSIKKALADCIDFEAKKA